MNNFNEKVSFIWSLADLLRGPSRPNQYKDVVQPFYEEHVTINGYSKDGKEFLEEIRLSSED